MMRQFAGLLGGLILACTLSTTLDASELLSATNLQQEAERATRAGGPLIVIYSRSDCKFCQAVKQDFLQPMANDPKISRRVLIREISQDSDAPLIDFSGRPSTHAKLSAAEKIKLVPVVAFYGTGGRRLAEPIVGARLPDFYQTYLDDAIEQATRKLKQP
jgi:thioredoxin-related protein